MAALNVIKMQLAILISASCYFAGKYFDWIANLDNPEKCLCCGVRGLDYRGWIMYLFVFIFTWNNSEKINYSDGLFSQFFFQS